VFPATPSFYYWSSSPLAFSADSAWLVNFNDGDGDSDGKGYYSHVRLVRGGQALPFGGLNDTGLDWWADGSHNSLASAPAGSPGQDASHGRDVTHDGDADGHACFVFTKLDASGNPLPAGAASWSCVRDEVTGLVWEGKTDDGGLRDKDWYYTWYDPNPATNGGSAGTPDPGAGGSDTCLDPARCDTDKYVADVSATALCGAADWRLPTREELRSLVDYSRYDPAIDTVYFPHMQFDGYCSSSPVAYHAGYAWNVNFYYGYDDSSDEVSYLHVRLVRGLGLDDHGNATGTATPIALGGTVSGTLEAGGDEDYFAVTVTAAGPLTVSTTGTTDTVLVPGTIRRRRSPRDGKLASVAKRPC
jgi:hypothetical protein